MAHLFSFFFFNFDPPIYNALEYILRDAIAQKTIHFSEPIVECRDFCNTNFFSFYTF